MGWSLVIAGGSLVLSAIAIVVTICNNKELSRLRRVDAPRAIISGQGTDKTHNCRHLTLRIANDDKSLWEIANIRIPPGERAEVSTIQYTEGPDPFGSIDPEAYRNPSQWGRSLALNPARPEFFLKPLERTITLVVGMRAKADPDITQDFNLQVPVSPH